MSSPAAVDSRGPGPRRRPIARLYPLLAVVVLMLAGFTAWVLAIVIEVRELRGEVEARVGALGRLSTLHATLASDPESARPGIRTVAEELVFIRAKEPDLDAALDKLEAADLGSSSGRASASAAIDAATLTLRKQTSDLSRRLASRWDAMYAIAFASLALAAATTALGIYLIVVREQRLERERALADERLVHANRLVAIGTLAAATAHEINNPLSFVMLNLEVLGSRLENDPELRELVAEIQEGVERVGAIAKDLKGFASTSSQEIARFDVNAAVSSALKIFSVARGRAELVRRLAPSAMVRGEPRRLEQVVLNLLINAGEAVHQDSERPARIEVTTRREPSGVVIEVIDNGGGIADEIRARLFQPFATTRGGAGGTGLGLFVCRGIVEGMGGTLELLPGEGGGTLARVSLPVDSGE